MKTLGISRLQELLDEGYEQILKEDALDYIREGCKVVCRVQSREFQEINTELGYDQCINLEHQKIYDTLTFYIKL